MSYRIIVTLSFEKQSRRLLKKYHSLKNELAELIISLKDKPEQGTPLSNHCFKIRLAIASKGKGKSGGARVITYVHVLGTTVFLLTIFDKSEKGSISEAELKELLIQIRN